MLDNEHTGPQPSEVSDLVGEMVIENELVACVYVVSQDLQRHEK